MLWFGRIALESWWCAASPALVQESVQTLLPRALGNAETVLFDAAAAARWTGTYAGRYGRLEMSLVLSADLGGPVQWAGPPPRDAITSYLRCAVVTRRGGTAAVAYFATRGCYRQEELARALEISFGNAHRRRGTASVLRSLRLPLPALRRPHQRDLAAILAVFRCENPACRSRGAEVLVPLRDIVDATLQRQRGAGAIAYPCPSCEGPWPARWALTWVRPHSPGAPLGACLVVDYSMAPAQPRGTARAGTMQTVTATPGTIRWGSVWDATTVPDVPQTLVRCARRPRLHALLRACRTDPTAAGALSAYLLTPDNLRAFVDYCRSLPTREKNGHVPTALARAFHPRRLGTYRTARDNCQTQEGHHYYIAFGPDRFFQQLDYFRLLDHTGRFLDVGSGTGEKVFLAFALGRFARCDGLEYDARTAAVAEFLFAAIAAQDPYPVRLFQGDALTFDRYGDYDVIYMFRPIFDEVRMGSLVRRIADQMKVGAVMFDVLEQTLALRKVDPDSFVTAAPGSDGFATWNEAISVDDLLARHHLV
ncbi:MAG: class I SAM-dependent methyltransferase [Pirellulaceae bacterium]|jgi:SAM-dependent methyltransferase|nr:class I SAM-dependent methyltransferase [Pirellulaceae bacterium]